MSDSAPHPRTITSPARLEAFSDGVLAIAVTLLVLEIKVPDAGQGALSQQLGALWPSYVAYAVSFLTIGIMWVNHHRMTSALRGVDHGLVYRNLALLGMVSFLPFPTAVLADYLTEGGSNAQAAAAFYGLTMVAVSVAFFFLWLHVDRTPDLAGPGATSNARSDVIGSAWAAGIYVGATGVAAFSAVAALAVYGAVAVAFAFRRVVGPQ